MRNAVPITLLPTRATWGIHSRAKLTILGFDHLIDHPRELLTVIIWLRCRESLSDIRLRQVDAEILH